MTEDDEIRERIMVKALFALLGNHKGKGLAIFDDITGKKYCAFVTEPDEENKCTLHIQESTTVEYDLAWCDVETVEGNYLN